MKKHEPTRFVTFILKLMKLSAYVVTILCSAVMMVMAHPPASAQGPLDKKLSINLSNEPLKQALDKITAVCGAKFTYNDDVANSKVKLSYKANDLTLREVLTEALANYPFSFSILDQDIYIRYDAKKSKKLEAGLAADPTEARRQENYTISGVVKSKGSGETIIAATIKVASIAKGTVSNEYGFFSLTLPKGSYELAVSAIGQRSKVVPVQLDKNMRLDIALDDATTELQTVNITAAGKESGRNIKNPQMGIERLSIQETKNIPVLLGERDILKTIQLLPGIKPASEGSGGFFVRGGTADQNMMLLDEAPVYNASHLLGFFSTFNSDAIKNVTVYKGGMPAQYGGGLSSVVDIRMNDGNNQKFGVSGGVGLIAARLNVEGPIQKDKSSFLISARRTYADMFLKLSSDSSLKKNTLYFYDVNAKANYVLGSKDRIYLSGYFGKDVLGSDKVNGINWGNATATLRWNHVFGSKLFSNTSLIYSNYDYTINSNSDESKLSLFSQIRDFNFKQDFQWYANEKNTVSMGLSAVYHAIKPGEVRATGNSGIISQNLQNRYSVESAAYISNTWKASDVFSLTYGLRVSAFSILGKGDYYDVDANGKLIDITSYKKGEVVKTYINPEPRIAAAFQLNSSTSLKASYVRNVQNLHLISNSNTSSPTDRWVASTNLIKPEKSDQVALGYYKNFGEKYEFTAETYYKTMDNQIDYRNGADVFTNKPLETLLLYGKGRAYGVEFLIKKKTGRLTGWLSYTLSKSERQIDGINNNQWYNARQDKTHDISIVTMYQLSKKWTLSANWVFSTGNAVTFPSGKYKVLDQTYYYYTERNAYRMPAYHRLDLGATYQLKQRKRFSSDLTFSLYNAYGRENAYRIDFRDNPTDPSKTEAVQVSLFRFVPSVSYNFKF